MILGLGSTSNPDETSVTAKLLNSLSLRGFVTYQLKYTAEACADFDRALKIEESVMLLNFMGRCHRDFGDPANVTVSVYNRALEIDPTFLEARISSTMAYFGIHKTI